MGPAIRMGASDMEFQAGKVERDKESGLAALQ